MAHVLKETENLEYLSSVIQRKIGLLSVDIKLLSVSDLIDKQFLLNEKTVLSEALKISENLSDNEELLGRLLDLPIFNATLTREERISEIQRILEVVEDDLMDCFVRGKI